MNDSGCDTPADLESVALLKHPGGWGMPIPPRVGRPEPSRMQEQIDRWLLDIGAIRMLT